MAYEFEAEESRCAAEDSPEATREYMRHFEAMYADYDPREDSGDYCEETGEHVDECDCIACQERREALHADEEQERYDAERRGHVA